MESEVVIEQGVEAEDLVEEEKVEEQPSKDTGEPESDDSVETQEKTDEKPAWIADTEESDDTGESVPLPSFLK